MDLECGLTCDDQFASSGAQLHFTCQPVLGAALVRLEAVVRTDVADLQLSRGQHHILSIYQTKRDFRCLVQSIAALFY